MWSFDGKTGHHRRVRSADSNPFRGPPLQKRSSSSYLDGQFSDPEARRPLAKATLPTFGAYESASTRRRPSAGLVRWFRYVAIAFFGAVLLASRDVGARGVVGRLRSAGRRHLLEASLPDQEVPDPAATETSADGRPVYKNPTLAALRAKLERESAVTSRCLCDLCEPRALCVAPSACAAAAQLPRFACAITLACACGRLGTRATVTAEDARVFRRRLESFTDSQNEVHVVGAACCRGRML